MGHKAHLKIQLVKFPGGSVGAAVFVTKAGGDLEILIKARHHKQLFEHLGGLGQGVKLAWVLAAGHHVIPRPLWRGSRQNRGLQFQKPTGQHGLPQRLNDVAAQHNVVVHPFAPQIQIPVTQAQFLGCVHITVDGKGQRVRLGQNRDLIQNHLDIARGDFGIDGFGRAGHHGAHHLNHTFGAHGIGHSKGRMVAAHNNLGYAVMIAHIHKQQVAVIPLAMHPPRQTNGLVHILQRQGVTGVTAIGIGKNHKDGCTRLRCWGQGEG